MNNINTFIKTEKKIMHINEKAEIILKAIKLAESKHKGQKRKVSGAPYFHHPLMVSYIAANFKKSKNLHNLIAASILHDVVEDTDANPEKITKGFGLLISSLVFELTDDKEEIKRVGKTEYQKNKWAGLSNYALFLKLCDRLYNISDNPTEDYIFATKEVLNHLVQKRKLTKSQTAVLKEIDSLLYKN